MKLILFVMAVTATVANLFTADDVSTLMERHTEAMLDRMSLIEIGGVSLGDRLPDLRESLLQVQTPALSLAGQKFFDLGPSGATNCSCKCSEKSVYDALEHKRVTSEAFKAAQAAKKAAEQAKIKAARAAAAIQKKKDEEAAALKKKQQDAAAALIKAQQAKVAVKTSGPIYLKIKREETRKAFVGFQKEALKKVPGAYKDLLANQAALVNKFGNKYVFIRSFAKWGELSLVDDSSWDNRVKVTRRIFCQGAYTNYRDQVKVPDGFNICLDKKANTIEIGDFSKYGGYRTQTYFGGSNLAIAEGFKADKIYGRGRSYSPLHKLEKTETWTYTYKDKSTNVGKYKLSHFGSYKVGKWLYSIPGGLTFTRDCGYKYDPKYPCVTGPAAFD